MPRSRNSPSPLVVLIATAAIVAGLYFAQTILIPIALAVLLSFLLTPLAKRVEMWGLPRIPAVIVVAGIAFAVLGVLISIVAAQAIELGSNRAAYQETFFGKIKEIGGESGPIGRVTSALDRLSRELAQEMKWLPQAPPAPGEPPDPEDGAMAVKVVNPPSTSSPLSQIGSWLGSITAPLSTAGLVVVLVLFMLVEREEQRNRFIELFGTSNLNLTTEALTDAASRVTNYLRMQFLINAGYGLCVGIALALFGVPGAIMWGVLGFMLRFLPYIGPILASLMPIAVSAAVSPGWTQPLLVAGFFIVLELILNNLVEPWLYGSSVGVSAVGVLVSAIFWTWLWGPIGLLLAMPLTVCLIVLSQYVPQLRFVNILLGDRPALSPAERTYQRLLAMDENEIRKLAQQHVKAESLAAYYDDVLIPALSMAKRHRHDGQLHEEQEAFIEETVEDLVEELGDAAESDQAKSTTAESSDAEQVRPGARVLCIPLRDRADQTTTAMLAQLLAAEGFDVNVGSVDLLTNELVDEVARLDSQMVVISILPPCSPRNSRLLYRRLRRQYPDLPVIIGYWGALPGEQLEQRFEISPPDRLVTRLSDAIESVRSTASGLRPADDAENGVAKTSTPEPAEAIAGDGR
jgi:predicted PurR-regulated permease PerM